MDNNQQIDLFMENLINAPVKGERALMEFPFFSLQKQKRTEPFVYDDGVVKIEVRPGASGMATIWDKDILIYCASLLNERMERGAPVEDVLHISAHDFLRATGRGTGKEGYTRMMAALDRLQSTQVKTTIDAGGVRDRQGFSWIDSYRVIEKPTKSGDTVMAAIRIRISEWMFRAITRDRRVLTIDRRYFDLKKGIERRLYELARKHCGYQQKWIIGIEKLAEKCGTQDVLRNFRASLKEIIKQDSLPQYSMTIVSVPRESIVFTPKPGPIAIDLTAPILPLDGL